VSKLNLTAELDALCDEHPKRLVSLVRLAWPSIKAALDRGHAVKVIHQRFVKSGVKISYRLFTMYVGQLRREKDAENVREQKTFNEFPANESFAREIRAPFNADDDRTIALVRVPKRRLLSAKAAAQYLGVHEQTLKKITVRGDLQARRIGSRRAYRLEDLDRYIESLPLSA
jgi:excisionase family DNA binding protein